MMIFWRYNTEKCHAKLGHDNFMIVLTLLDPYFEQITDKGHAKKSYKSAQHNQNNNRYSIMSQSWYVYLLRCSDNSLYAGITTDITRRINEHNQCNKLGSKYTRVRRPVSLVYNEEYENRSAASKREYQLKQLTKKQKERLFT